ncbi:cupin domain-containing protein [Rhodocytophaga rosea]|uniref:hypothetical protein n=1 Tax=Rhodocytophaga rosea TaxID=2704465 RepID=UPI00293C0776|nr:hypothetical protein [Rhodocytophaga rosea]
MRTIRKIHTAQYVPMGDLITYTPLPSRTLSSLDPFLLLNHHGLKHISRIIMGCLLVRIRTGVWKQ